MAGAGAALVASPAAAQTISTEQAIAIAQGVVPGMVIEADLEWEQGLLIYEVLLSGHEVYVNASTGAIVKVEAVSPDDW